MNELPNHELDERLQKQILQAQKALQQTGAEYVVQVCGELLRKHPSAYEVRALLWEALRDLHASKSSGVNWLLVKSNTVQFKLATRSLLAKDPLELIRRCDDFLRRKQVFPDLFVTLDKAAESLGWLDTRVLACRVLTELAPSKAAPRLSLATVLVEAQRPQDAIEHIEWVLTREPSNGDAQTLLKNASVAETLQRGNWESTETTFHSKLKD